MKRQAAVRTVMPANREIFTNFPAATAALLAGPSGINLHVADTSLLSFVPQHAQEAGPAGVTDCPAQPAVRQHPFDVERFGSDEAVGKDQPTGDLVVVLTPQVLDSGVDLLQTADSLAAVAPTLLLAADGAAGNTQGGECPFEVAWVRFALPVAGGQEGLKAHVDADRGQGGRLDLHVRQLAGEGHVPLAGLPLEGGCLDLP